MIEAVLFDLDDTLLIDEDDVVAVFARITGPLDKEAGVAGGTVADAVRSTARAHWRAGPYFDVALRLGLSSWEGLAADFTDGHPVVDVLREWAPGFRRRAWAEAVGPFGVDTERAHELAESYRTERRAAYRLFDDTNDVLTQLRRDRGLRLAIVTNGPPDLQREKVAMTGLADRVDAVAISGVVGEGKPDAGIFRAALEAIGGADPAATVMVGDSLERDMQGADALGITTVWRPNPRRTSDGTWPTSIQTLSELEV